MNKKIISVDTRQFQITGTVKVEDQELVNSLVQEFIEASVQEGFSAGKLNIPVSDTLYKGTWVHDVKVKEVEI